MRRQRASGRTAAMATSNTVTRTRADLYEEVDLQPFSTLITTEYDPATRQVVRSERITPLYQHQEP